MLSVGASSASLVDDERGKRKRSSRIGSRISTGDTVEELLAAQRSQALRNRFVEEKQERPIFFEPSNLFAAEPKRATSDRFGADAGAHSSPAVARFAQSTTTAERRAEQNRLAALQRRSAMMNSTATPINFYDVVDSELISQSNSTDFADRLAGKVIESPIFQRFILSCIVCNSILSFLYTKPYFEQNYGRLIDEADSVFLTIFVIEISLKIKHLKGGFWHDNWNIFDFSLVMVSVLGTIVRDVGTRQTIGSRVLRFLRVLRAFRTLRILGALRKLQVVVNTFLKSLLELANILAMIVLLLFMFGILGLQILGELVPQYFGTLVQSFLSLFILITQDGWVNIWKDVEAAMEDPANDVGALSEIMFRLYFIVFIVIGAWVFINMISGITVTNWQLYVDEMREMESAKFHEIGVATLRDRNHANEVRAISEENISSSTWANQRPLTSASSLGRLSVQKLENYMLVISAMQQNSLEYAALRKKLKTHMAEVHATNMLLEGPGDVDEDEDDAESLPRRVSITNVDDADADALTRMQHLRRESIPDNHRQD
ncbi:Cation channel sperm-associated protein 4 (CatSper4), partial [Durusdinium trenchii]